MQRLVGRASEQGRGDGQGQVLEVRMALARSRQEGGLVAGMACMRDAAGVEAERMGANITQRLIAKVWSLDFFLSTNEKAVRVLSGEVA